MDVVRIVFLKTLSVLLSVLIGFIAGRYSSVDKESISSLLFYFISPIVFFAIPASTSLSLSSLSITLTTFIIASIISIFSYYFFGKYFQDDTRGMIALSAGNANVGYFTLPVASALFDDYTLGIYMMAIMGISIYESSIGLYFGLKQKNTTKETIIKICKLPIFNAFFLGCLLSMMGFSLPNFLDDFVYNMRAAYSVLGMIIVGVSVAKVAKFEIYIKFTLATFTAKFIFYPVLVNIFILFDSFVTNWYDQYCYNALQLLSMAPMATNIIIIANIQKFHPERVATTVLLSLLFALLYMPIMVGMLLSDIS